MWVVGPSKESKNKSGISGAVPVYRSNSPALIIIYRYSFDMLLRLAMLVPNHFEMFSRLATCVLEVGLHHGSQFILCLLLQRGGGKGNHRVWKPPSVSPLFLHLSHVKLHFFISHSYTGSLPLLSVYRWFFRWRLPTLPPTARPGSRLGVSRRSTSDPGVAWNR